MNDLKRVKTKQSLIIIAYLLLYILFTLILFLCHLDFDINIDNRYTLKSLGYSDSYSEPLDTEVCLIDNTSSDVLAINGYIHEFQLYNDVIVGNMHYEIEIDSDKNPAPKGYFILDRKSGKAILGLSKNKFMKILSEKYNINEMPKFEDGARNYHKYFGLKPKDQK